MENIVKLSRQKGTLLPENALLILQAPLGEMTTINLFIDPTVNTENKVQVALIIHGTLRNLFSCATEAEGIDYFFKYCQRRGLEACLTLCPLD